MKKTLLFFTLFLLNILCSCDETSHSDSCSIEDDLMMQTGNWWIYKTHLLDSAGNIIPDSVRMDSVVVAGTRILFNKTAYMLIRYSSFDNFYTMAPDTYYISIEKNKAFMPINHFTSEINNCPDCFYPHDDWMKIADCSERTWEIYDKTKQETIPVLKNNEPIEVYYKARYLINGYKSFEYINTQLVSEGLPCYKVSGGIDVLEVTDPDVGELMKSHFFKAIWLKKGVGIIREIYKSHPARRSGKKYPDYISELLKYFVKQ